MKHFFTLLTLLAGLQTISTAQITITAADMPVVNEIYTFVSADSQWVAGIDISAGANKTWDFSGATENGDAPILEAWVHPGATTFGGDFPTATIASTDPAVETDSADANYYILSNTALSNVGSGSVFGNSYYSPAQEALRFPLTYNTAFSSISDIETSVEGLPVNGTSAMDVIVDGWGTLITPFGTFQALRVHRTSEISFTIFGLPATALVESIEFMGKEYGRPLFIHETVSSTFFGETTTEVSGGWISDATVSVNAPSQEVNQFSISPNPAADRIHLEVAVKGNHALKACIFSSTGQLMSVTTVNGHQTTQQIPVDIAALPTGHYTVVLFSANGKVWGSRQLVKE